MIGYHGTNDDRLIVYAHFVIAEALNILYHMPPLVYVFLLSTGTHGLPLTV